MSTPTALVNLHNLLKTVSQNLKIHSRQHFDINNQESYESFLNIICEYIFLTERLQNLGNIYTEMIHNKLRDSSLCIKIIFMKLFLFKHHFPISILNETFITSMTGLSVIFGWVLERTNVLMYISKYLLQYRTGELFLPFKDLMLDPITLYPPVHLATTKPVHSLPLKELLTKLKSEYSKVCNLLRELSLIVEYNSRNQFLLTNSDSKELLLSRDPIVNSFSKEARIGDLYFLQSKRLVKQFCTISQNQISAINTLRSLYTKLPQFWDQIDLADTEGETRQTHECTAPTNLPTNRGIPCFINVVISLPTIVLALGCEDSIFLEKEELRSTKEDYQARILNINEYVTSCCLEFNSKYNAPLVCFKLD